jgi:Ca2+-transporting ATPase
MDWHTLSPEEVTKQFGSKKKGLSFNEANKRLTKYGYNEIKHEKRITIFHIFLNQFKDFLVLVLLAATVISLLFGFEKDAIVIGIILILNAILGTIQEHKAEKAIDALKVLAAPKAVVVREGKEMKISAKELVPGDIVLLDTGDRVPADARLIEEMDLKVDESHLTGESVPEEKNIGILKEDVVLADRMNMIYFGTIVSYGIGKAIVTETGMKTEMGKIATLIQETKDELTPLQVKLKQLGKQLGIFIFALAAIILAIGMIRGIAFPEMFITVVALAVSAIPEGLPAVITLTLAIGMQVMAKQNAIVRKLPAVETLGSATVICADKTGTITKNEMTVKELYISGVKVDVGGQGYEIDGTFTVGGKKVDPKKSKDLSLILRIGSLCNNAHYNDKTKNIIGDPTEGSLLILARKAGFTEDGLKERYPYVAELPFDSNRKRMTTIHKEENKIVAYTKGAVESLLRKCSHIYEKGKIRKITQRDVNRIIKTNASMAKGALRVLGMAFRTLPSYLREYDIKKVENNLIFVGLVGMIDPPREEARSAIKTSEEAGIKVIMITGDYALTAKAIGKEVGLLKKDSKLLTGKDVDLLSNKELEAGINDVSIFARVSPHHKVRIVKALKRKGHVVAMTGDGVNDAPSLKCADIGVSMGITGTDVAKEASDMILADDNFATIVNAVKQGRVIFDNIKEFIRYLLSANFDELLVVSVAAIMGLPLPFIAIQILWINLITDGLPALALSVNPASEDVMKRKPRNPKKSVLKEMLPFIVTAGVLAFALTLFVFLLELQAGGTLNKARTMAFTQTMMFELFLVFSISAEKKLIWQKGFFRNKYLIIAVIASFLLHLMILYVPFFQTIFETEALGLADWSKILLLASTAFLLSPKFFKHKEKVSNQEH